MAKREDELLAFFSDIPLLRAAITDPEPRRKQPDRPGAIARQIEAIRNSEGVRVIADLLGRLNDGRQAINRWLEEHAPEGAEVVAEAEGGLFGDLAERFGPDPSSRAGGVVKRAANIADLLVGSGHAGELVEAPFAAAAAPVARVGREVAPELMERAAREVERIAAIPVPAEKARAAAMRSAGTQFQPVDAARFHEAITAARSAQKGNIRAADMLSVYSPEEYAEMRTFLSPDGLTGYAIKPDGDLVSVFSRGPRGAGADAVRHAIEQGATKLDAFEPFLPAYYRQFGFEPTGTFANWEIGGDPVTFMEYRGGRPVGEYPDYQRLPAGFDEYREDAFRDLPAELFQQAGPEMPRSQLELAAGGGNVGSSLTEQPAFRRESVERSPSWGHDVFRYSTPQGPLEVIAVPKGSEIEIGWFGKPESGEGSMPVGPRVVRGIMEDVASHYPDAETFGFSRISGSRTGPASGRTVEEAEPEWISRPIPRPKGFQPPAQGLFDSGAASIGGRPAQPEMPRPVLTEAASGDNVGIALNRSILDQIVDTHNTMGGSTFNPRTGENLYGQPGFAVGAERSTERIIDSPQLTTEDLIRYQQDNPQLVTDPQSLLGTWVEGNQSYLDTPSLFKTERGAVRAGADNEQLAIFNLGTGEERPITVDELADSRHRRANRNKATRGALEERLQEGLLPHERRRFEGLDKRTRQNVLDVFARMPTPEELSHSMLAGMGHHGWYDTAAQTIAQVFGDDSHRFAALLAATSPRQSVEQNLDMALDIWDRWVRAGRPTDEAGIRATFPSDIMEGRAQNAVKSLAAPEELLRDPKVITEGGFLSGPKVDPFYGNLVGEVDRVVNDTHMAQLYGANPNSMAKVGRLLPGTAATRLGGRIVQENLGIPFPGSRAQETGWSWKYALSNARDNISSSGRLPGASHDDIVREGFDLGPYLSGVARFDTMLRDPARAERIARIPGLMAPGAVTEPFTPSVDPGLIDRTALRRLAQRVDAVSAGRPLVGLLGAGLGLGAMQGLFSPEEEVQ